MEYEIKPFGDNGLHIVLSRKAGFKAGDKVLINNPVSNVSEERSLAIRIYKLIKGDIQSQIDSSFEEVKKY